MELKHIEYLLQVAEQGSLSKAAKALYTSQPNLSIALKEIEEELNIKIFNRTNRGITPTEEGQELIDSLSTIYHQLDFVIGKYNCANSVQDKIYLLHNDLISLADSFYNFKLSKQLPDLSCEIRSMHLMPVLENIAVVPHAAMGIIAIPRLDFHGFKHIISSKGLSFSPLFIAHSCLIVGPQHPFYNRDSVTLDDITNCELLFYSMSHLIQSSKFVSSFNLGNAKFSFNSKDSVMSLITQSTMCGIGCDCLESSLYINSPLLKYIPIDNEKVDLLFGTVTNRNFFLDDTYDLYVEYLKENFKKTYTY